ncbi:MAG: DNA topoisomerase IV subunit A [Candidatus Thorarchaeota archaeon]|jgi:DNA topoisomerase-6 subunit A
MHDTNKALKALKEFGQRILQPILDESFPKVEIPDRKTNNIVFDDKTNQYVLGPSSNVRDSSNVKHVRSFAKLTWAAAFAKELVQASRTSSLRDLYYSAEAFGVKFGGQSESDRIVTDLECITGLPRESFGIYPEEHSSIYGKVKMRYTVPGYEGKEIDLTVMFSRLIETRAWDRFSAILVQLGGQPPRATRRLMRNLHTTLGLPVFVFTDGDPWGMHIARVITCGSANAAHISDLTIPSATWIGVTPEDITEYALPTESLNNADMKRLDELSRDVRYSTTVWQDYIREFRHMRVKAEQQAFSRYGMDYVVDTYLSDKLL